MNTIYWTTTLLVATLMLWSAYSDLLDPGAIEGFRDLGFPDFFRIQLGILKVLGVLALLVPQLPAFVKEWAYAGIGLFLITAFVAHVVHRDGVAVSAILVFFFGLLVVSNVAFHRLGTV